MGFIDDYFDGDYQAYEDEYGYPDDYGNEEDEYGHERQDDDSESDDEVTPKFDSWKTFLELLNSLAPHHCQQWEFLAMGRDRLKSETAPLFEHAYVLATGLQTLLNQPPATHNLLTAHTILSLLYEVPSIIQHSTKKQQKSFKKFLANLSKLSSTFSRNNIPKAGVLSGRASDLIPTSCNLSDGASTGIVFDEMEFGGDENVADNRSQLDDGLLDNSVS